MGAERVGIVVVDERGAGSGRAQALGALEPVANRPIVHHVLDALESAGVTEMLVVSPAEVTSELRHCLAARDRRDGAPVGHLEHDGPVDLPGALSLAAAVVGSAPCIVHLASGLLGEPIAPFRGRLAVDSPDVTLFVHQGQGGGEHLSAATQEMLHLAELDPQRAALNLAGVLLLGPNALHEITRERWHGGGDVDLTTMAALVTAAGGNFEVLAVDAWRRYAGDPLDLLELNRIALDRIDTKLRRPCSNGNQIEGRVWIHERASVRASVIVGPVVIGAGAQICDAYIGPYTSIGPGAYIEGAEIERSIIASGAHITHVGGRLAASVVGRDARVFRDFSLPRALRLRVGEGTEVALC
jgi:glucose-1-phosphate thymidylyltransferase